MYHRLGDGGLPGREPGENRYAVGPATFEAQLEILRERSCAVLALEAIGQGQLPPRSVSITFDDGNATDHAVALPALGRRGLKAAFFITPAWVGTAGYLDWPEIKELLAAGMTVGAHGLDHSRLADLGPAELRSHLSEARRLMEARMGRAPVWLSLPGGAGGQREVAAAREVGFERILGSVPTLCFPDTAEPLPRFAVRRGDSAAAFRALAEQRRDARLRHWLRHHALQSLRPVLGRSLHARLRSAWAASTRDE